MPKTILLPLSILMLVNCQPSAETIQEAFEDFQNTIISGNPRNLAEHYVKTGHFTKESNLAYASSILQFNKEHKLKTTHNLNVLYHRASGNFSAIVIVDDESTISYPAFAKKTNDKYKFFRPFNLWSNGFAVESYGLSEEDTNTLKELRAWAFSKTR